jgi:iron complex transport system substrate-binding protein
MKLPYIKIIATLLLVTFIGCKKNETSLVNQAPKDQNIMMYASGLEIYDNEGYSKVKISKPWPNAKVGFTYILKKKNTIIPDSLKKYTSIVIPIQTVVVTSTTNIPFLEMLGVENTLKGFPNTDYVSSVKTRKLIDSGKVQNVGQNESLNIEKLIDMAPDLIVTFGIDDNNPTLSNLQKSGLKVLIQGDWMEQSPLGKAEWIKLYGVLFGKKKQALLLFDQIVKSYQKTLLLVNQTEASSDVLYGSMYQDQWYVAKGDSWVSQFISDAKANYLWSNLPGVGSEALAFESVFEKAQNANVWITGSFKNLDEMKKTNPHYEQFKAFKNNMVYTFENRKGEKGGVVFYELAPSRPDLVLKDYIKIFHPSLLPNYSFTFAQKIN